MSKINIPPIRGGYNLSKINDAIQTIEDHLNEKVLYRDTPEGEPNQMNNDLDMNGKRIYNLPEPIEPHEAATKEYVEKAALAVPVESFVRTSPDEVLNELPDPFDRAGKMLTFDENGQPSVQFPAQDSALQLRTDLQDYSGVLGADPKWSDISAHSDPAFDVQTQALANRTEFIKSAVLSYPDYATAEAAAAELPDGQVIVVEAESVGKASGGLYVEDSGVPLHTLQNYADLEAYSGKQSQILLTTPGIYGTVYRDDEDTTTPTDYGTVFIDALGRRWKRPITDGYHAEWFGVKYDGSDAGPAMTLAFAACNAVNPAADLIISGMVTLLTPAVIDRPIDTPLVQSYLNIVGRGARRLPHERRRIHVHDSSARDTWGANGA